MSGIPISRRRLARIRCIQDCITAFKQIKKLPECLCYVPSEIVYHCQNKTTLKIYQDTHKNSKKCTDLTITPEYRLYVSGEEFCNVHGKWLRIKKFKNGSSSNDITYYDNEAWILQYSSKSSTDDSPALVPVPQEKGAKKTPLSVSRWEEVMEQHYAAQLPSRCLEVILPDQEAVNRLREIPANWTIENDEALVRLLSQHIPPENDNLGSIRNFVESIDVSSSCDDCGVNCLTDGDPNSYWESDGSQGQHWIQLRMKKGTIILKLQLMLDRSDDNYLPARIVVQGGEQDNLKTLKSLDLDCRNISEVEDVTLLENQTEHYPIIMIRIKECKAGGIDTRIRGIKISSSEGRYLGFDRDCFKGENLTRFPKLEPYSPDQLYRRAIVLQRFMTILDSVLPFLVPAWEYSVGSYSSLEYVRQLLPLSKKRLSLIDTFLKESASEPPDPVKLFINRRAAMEHRCDPSNDNEYRNTIFMQIYEGLKPRDRSSKPLNYRWPARHDQWWECKFMSEGVIDQGGGFRDSLSDLAEELCPMASDVSLPLPFFIRTPNQICEDSNLHRDVYIPNPSCKEFSKYEWLGQLMGACLRGKENLVLAFPPYIWKKLVGERVSWVRDYHTVDAAEVKLIDSLESLDEEKFNNLGRNWSITMNDGNIVILKVDSQENPKVLSYEDRLEFCDKVRQLRMEEGSEQIAAMRKGLLKVIPQAVLDLLTWQELEHRISGDPEISMEALKRSIHYDDLEEKDTRVKFMWTALSNFSNEDRSRFLRFVTGRRRLPAPVYVSSGKGDAVDSLPESSTCANVLYLPDYSSAKIAEEKIRYASYNCVDMDADVNPWDD